MRGVGGPTYELPLACPRARRVLVRVQLRLTLLRYMVVTLT